MNRLHECLDGILPRIIDLSEEIYRNPELGFKEFATRKKVIAVLDEAGIPHRDEAYTGIVAELDSGKKGPHIGMIAEFDAVPTLGHPYANPEDHAAHTCGHYGQLGVMLSLFLALKEPEVLKRLCGKVSLLITPAEEFCDMDYRKDLIRKGILDFPSGKQQMIATGVFDTVDIMLSCHAMGIDMHKYHAEIGSSLNGFIQKTAIFHGKATHAGANPEGGINALNAATLGVTALNFLRETFSAEDAIRLHFIITEGGQTINTIPSRVQLEMYIRARSLDAIFATNKKVDRALRGAALAGNCRLEIENTPGYFPLQQDPLLTEVCYRNIKKYIPEEQIAQGTHGFASGDMGDVSLMWPTVEIGVAGFSGTLHGKDFKTEDPEQAFRIPAHYFADVILDLLAEGGKEAYRIKNHFRPSIQREAYLETMKKLKRTDVYEREE